MTRDDLKFYVHSKWGDVQAKWEGVLRSNSVFRVLDLNDIPGLYGFHIAYNVGDDKVSYILITLDKDECDMNWVYEDEEYSYLIENFETYSRVTIYRRHPNETV